ncbi:MAG: hypothetical protein M3Z54_14340 [Gemmatimonadota bacterium]|nr:hypothetical protein [Gemmatimonadota bacterium]
MAPPVPQTEPQILVAGDTWAWNKTLASYPPAEGWTLGYAIRGQSVLANTDVVVATSGAGYAVSVAKAKTAPLISGAYQWQSFVDKASGEHYTVEQGVFQIVASMSAVVDNSAVRHVERVLAKIELEIEARITGTGSSHESYSINGRSMMKIPTDKLIRMRTIYQAKIFRLNNPGKLGPTVLAMMNNPDGTIGTSEPVVLPPWYRALVS